MAVTVHGLQGRSLRDLPVTARAWTSTTRIANYRPEDLLEVGEDSFVLPLDTAATGPGLLTVEVTVAIPDADFPDGARTEVARTGHCLTIIP